MTLRTASRQTGQLSFTDPLLVCFGFVSVEINSYHGYTGSQEKEGNYHQDFHKILLFNLLFSMFGSCGQVLIVVVSLQIIRNNLMDLQRIGKFYVTRAALYGPEMPEVLAKMEFVPLRVELLAHNDTFEYVGISHVFNVLTKGHKVPEYIIKIADDGATLTVTAEAV